ncbi:MAG: alpha/beta fold hydrolase [Mariniblastus sp.]
MNCKTIETANASFNVVDQGEGSPILFVHGFPLDHSMWRFQIETFSKTNRVICPDLPGFGKSHLKSDSEMSLELLGNSLAELLTELQINEPLVFCGLSMGGYVGWQFWKNHSRLLCGMVACNTRAANDTEQVARGRQIGAESVRKTGAAPIADALIPKLFYQPESDKIKLVAAEVRQVICKTDRESIASGQIAMSQREDSTPWLDRIELPVLFIAGQHDPITPSSEMRENARLVPKSCIREITNAGHMTPLEQPDEFNDALREYLDQISTNR